MIEYSARVAALSVSWSNVPMHSYKSSRSHSASKSPKVTSYDVVGLHNVT